MNTVWNWRDVIFSNKEDIYTYMGRDDYSVVDSADYQSKLPDGVKSNIHVKRNITVTLLFNKTSSKAYSFFSENYKINSKQILY